MNLGPFHVYDEMNAPGNRTVLITMSFLFHRSNAKLDLCAYAFVAISNYTCPTLIFLGIGTVAMSVYLSYSLHV